MRYCRKKKESERARGRRVRGEQGEVEEGEEGAEDKRGGGGEQGEGEGRKWGGAQAYGEFFSIFVYIRCNKFKKIKFTRCNGILSTNF